MLSTFTIVKINHKSNNGEGDKTYHLLCFVEFQEPNEVLKLISKTLKFDINHLSVAKRTNNKKVDFEAAYKDDEKLVVTVTSNSFDDDKIHLFLNQTVGELHDGFILSGDRKFTSLTAFAGHVLGYRNSKIIDTLLYHYKGIHGRIDEFPVNRSLVAKERLSYLYKSIQSKEEKRNEVEKITNHMEHPTLRKRPSPKHSQQSESSDNSAPKPPDNKGRKNL